MRRWTTGVLSIGMLSALAWYATAATMQDGPLVSDRGITLSVSGTVDGLAAADAVVRVRAVGTATVRCVNPAGNEPPSMTRTVRVTVNGAQRIPASRISAGGDASFDVVTADPSVTAVQARCPGRNWTVEVTEVRFQTANLRVVQNGSTVLRRVLTL